MSRLRRSQQTEAEAQKELLRHRDTWPKKGSFAFPIAAVRDESSLPGEVGLGLFFYSIRFDKSSLHSYPHNRVTLAVFLFRDAGLMLRDGAEKVSFQNAENTFLALRRHGVSRAEVEEERRQHQPHYGAPPDQVGRIES